MKRFSCLFRLIAQHCRHRPGVSDVKPLLNLICSRVAVERVRRLTITSAETSEEWTYFESRWNDNKEATKIKDVEHVATKTCPRTSRVLKVAP
ncbi:hypothetical protein DPMN_000814 [Dreissena polymorpha]|uniref:Uncharacterized protein n=1 Tax=Dreissena polymorpha TaxID=45954 RepID=A0A9D4RPU1_DREPO|nr:hypothetical protein DPMN_000814 [Dreissena polymorpha]